MFHRTLLTLVAIPALGWAANSARAADPTGAKVDFNFDIRPVISAKCFHCHGPDEKSRKAKLRLDLRTEALKEHEDGPTIVPGSASDSALIARITSKDPDEVMPPPKENHALTAQEIQLLQRWIDQGAEYKPHWAFVQPERAAIPGDAEYDLKLAELAKWPRNPIDHFVLARMLEQGLTPSPEADPGTLCRRLYFDLTGLPPSLDDVDTFREASSRDPQAAIESLVDQLLASPAYGERWAKMWLDLARYADSTGYGSIETG